MNATTERRQPVCRSLFGPVDHEQLRRDLKLKLREMAEQDARRWNFDFQTETPLPGRFEWEEEPADRAADFYQRSALRSPSTEEEEEEEEEDRGSGAGADQENCPRISNTHKRPAEVTPVRRKRAPSKPAAKRRNDARITDFFAKRRRTTDTKSLLSPPHAREAAPCRTIRGTVRGTIRGTIR